MKKILLNEFNSLQKQFNTHTYTYMDILKVYIFYIYYIYLYLIYIKNIYFFNKIIIILCKIDYLDLHFFKIANMQFFQKYLYNF